ncbi:MAG TPA: glycoside hydrolase family 127 protein, partial [Planctomycetota bacterium]|nr:glycoside hydrolase family 127 protein [Planctomycetota bacterium]
HRPDLLGGITVIEGEAESVRRTADGRSREPAGKVRFTAIPYHLWAHRGRTPMAVWLATGPEVADPAPGATLAWRAKRSASHNGHLVDALADQLDVTAPGDTTRPHFHWWNRLGGTEWVQYEFDEETTVRGCQVYWFRDVPRGACDVPASWCVLWRDGEEWKPVDARGGYPTEAGTFVEVEWTPVRTRALRLEVQCKPNLSAGIHEWRVVGDG